MVAARSTIAKLGGAEEAPDQLPDVQIFPP